MDYRSRIWTWLLNTVFFRSIADTENSFKKLFELGGSCGDSRQLEYASNSCGFGRWVEADAFWQLLSGKGAPRTAGAPMSSRSVLVRITSHFFGSVLAHLVSGIVV